MANKNRAERKFPQQQCAHGECLKHSPEWQDVGPKRCVPNPGMFFSTYWFGKVNRCCGRPTLRVKEVQTRQCQRCGRKEECVTDDKLHLCSCCGRTFSVQYATIPG